MATWSAEIFRQHPGNNLQFGTVSKRLDDPWSLHAGGDPWVLPDKTVVRWDGGGLLLHSHQSTGSAAGDRVGMGIRKLPQQFDAQDALPDDVVFPVELNDGTPAGLSLAVLTSIVKHNIRKSAVT